jgi:hypothetical protein
MNSMQNTRRRLTGDRNQCPGCGQFFNSTSSFDAHRTGPFGTPGEAARRRCMTVEEMQAKGMTLNQAGYWVQRALGAAGIAKRRASRESDAGADAAPENHRV